MAMAGNGDGRQSASWQHNMGETPENTSGAQCSAWWWLSGHCRPACNLTTPPQKKHAHPRIMVQVQRDAGHHARFTNRIHGERQRRAVVRQPGIVYGVRRDVGVDTVSSVQLREAGGGGLSWRKISLGVPCKEHPGDVPRRMVMLGIDKTCNVAAYRIFNQSVSGPID